MNKIRRCVECGRFTLAKECHEALTEQVAPAKFSPEDKYARYRRMAKEQNVER